MSFSSIFNKTYISTNSIEKFNLALYSSFGAIMNPERGDLVACLGDVTSFYALKMMRNNMIEDDEGREILLKKPLINDQIDYEYLRGLPDKTLGREYTRFMDKFGFKAEDRESVKYINDEELSYVLTRYRQIHDFHHVLYNLDISVENELAIKTIELMHTKLPVTALSSLVGGLSIYAQSDNPLAAHYLWLTELYPWAVNVARKVKKPLYMIYLEKWFERPIEDLRRYSGVIPWS
eukprot:GHVL01021794.1.p1 GENE.GHVL01021794.1~~GHVL01021794.1.p1  ORF type:complete len:235 (-),score=42.10 GHVL01021794.1:215-919(-)